MSKWPPAPEDFVTAGPILKEVVSECDLYGHDYQIREDEYAQAEGRTPTSLFCPRCGKSWKVER